MSQNILIIYKNTSFEEIESFLYRAILCKYHTLFTVGIYDISPKQEDYLMKIVHYLIKFITERDNSNNKKNKKIIDIKPFIVFIYNTKINKSQSHNKFIDQIKRIAGRKNLKRKKKAKPQEEKKKVEQKEDKKDYVKINELKYSERTESFDNLTIN